VKKRYKFDKNGTAIAKRQGLGIRPVKEPTLFADEEGTFYDNRHRRRVTVHLVPAPWSRVLTYSLIYAFAVAMVQEVWFWSFGKPNWLPIAIENAAPEDLEQVQTPE
jgi:hypothetical protein